MKEYIFTFGSGQPNADGFHAIVAETPLAARRLMFGRFGDKWYGQYNSREEAGVERFNLIEVA